MAADLGTLAQVGLFAGVAYLMFRYGACCVPRRRRNGQRDGAEKPAPGDPVQELKAAWMSTSNRWRGGAHDAIVRLEVKT